MEIPVEKKPRHYLAFVAVFLIGLIVGGILMSYLFFKVKDRLGVVTQPPQISTDITPAQIERVTEMDRNRTIFGTVTAKDANSFTLQFAISNPFDSANSTTTTARIPFDGQTDEVIKPTPSGSAVKEEKATLNDIKVGQLILLRILDGKKTVFIPAS
jgi:hypothetical protein